MAWPYKYVEELSAQQLRYRMRYAGIVAAVIRQAIDEEGPDYLLASGGKFWCGVGDINPTVALQYAKEQEVWR